MNKDKGRGGIVVSIASVAGLDGFYSMPAYSATKHAVVGLNRCLGVRNFVIIADMMTKVKYFVD